MRRPLLRSKRGNAYCPRIINKKATVPPAFLTLAQASHWGTRHILAPRNIPIKRLEHVERHAAHEYYSTLANGEPKDLSNGLSPFAPT